MSPRALFTIVYQASQHLSTLSATLSAHTDPSRIGTLLAPLLEAPKDELITGRRHRDTAEFVWHLLAQPSRTPLLPHKPRARAKPVSLYLWG